MWVVGFSPDMRLVLDPAMSKLKLPTYKSTAPPALVGVLTSLIVMKKGR